MLVAATNPCPCGFAARASAARARDAELARHRRRLSGPLLDRIDLFAVLARRAIRGRLRRARATSSRARASRWRRHARARRRRLRDEPIALNAHLDASALERHLDIENGARELVLRAGAAGLLSARGQHARATRRAHDRRPRRARPRPRRDVGAALALRRLERAPEDGGWERGRRRRNGRRCAGCLRRSWLLGQLIVPLDYCARDRTRLLDALELDDRELLAALAGRRRDELRARLRQQRGRNPSPSAASEGGRPAAVCCHDAHYPERLRRRPAPRLLFTSAGVDRLSELTAGPVVAIVGSIRPSDYGAEMARALARGLAAAGVAVAVVARRGIAAAAGAGVEELGAGLLAVAIGGLDCPDACVPGSPGARSAVRCTVAELPRQTRGRTFGQIAAQRTLVALADTVLCVEARGCRELLEARLARSWGVRLAAVPGRVTSPGGEGPNALLRDGATLVRCPEDVLEVLAPLTGSVEGMYGQAPVLDARLRGVLERVGSGLDTAERICAERRDPGATLLALSELELLGLLGRGEAGRYVVRCTAPGVWTGGEPQLTGLKPERRQADDLQ